MRIKSFFQYKASLGSCGGLQEHIPLSYPVRTQMADRGDSPFWLLCHKTFLSTPSTKFLLRARENLNPAVLIGWFSSMSTKTALKCFLI